LGLDLNVLTMESNEEGKVMSFSQLEKFLLEARFNSIQEHENGILDSFNLYLASIGLMCMYLLSVVVHNICSENHYNRSKEEGCKVAGCVFVRIC